MNRYYLGALINGGVQTMATYSNLELALEALYAHIYGYGLVVVDMDTGQVWADTRE